MKTISLREPFASLVKEGVKKIETRSWQTKYRGELYIHASKRKLTKKDEDVYKKVLAFLNDADFKYGYIIAKSQLVACILIDRKFIKKINKKEYLCGDYQIGRYAWILEEIEVLEEPISAKGQLGIWMYKKNRN